MPLLGVPFAIKDNIDVAGLPTTVACPEFSWTPETTAPAVQRLLDAGAILVGKTNLDQFATGLVGTRSPYGIVPNVFDPRYISGGSSSGSASVVARGLVPFALGTDTAGSGRVPAGFNNIVGLKPTRGWISTRGVFPACRTLDCVSVFALTVADAALATSVAAGPDAIDGYSRTPPPGALTRRLPAAPDTCTGAAASPPPDARLRAIRSGGTGVPSGDGDVAAPKLPDTRPRLGIPATPEWFGDRQAAAAWERALDQARATGAVLVPLDFSLLFEVAALLYQGPWVAERYAAIESLITTQPEAIHPVVRGIIEQARRHDAVSVFRAQYRLADLKRTCDALTASVDALLVPTAPTLPTIADVLANPVEINSRLGTWTNFVNLLDGCALALPAPFRDDGLPAGVTLIAPAWSDAALAAFGQTWEHLTPQPPGIAGLPPFPDPAATPLPFPSAPTVRLAVVGAHLRGLPLNHQLTERGAVLVEQTTTSPDYRLFALPGTVPPKPGLVKTPTGDGAPIVVELWDMPVEAFGSFVALVPPPLGIGTLTLADGRTVKGFICETWATADARDITDYGGWRAFLAATNPSTPAVPANA
ncbi:allophanate hydrolase [Opitutaceae bacterium TAV5]|nr:allophanate hydrolase [Opitutaceae bacterium TAV5]